LSRCQREPAQSRPQRGADAEPRGAAADQAVPWLRPGAPALSGIADLPLTLFATAFGMGLAFCGPPGAVFAEASRRGAARGFAAALTVEFGSLIGDTIWAVLGLSGAGLLLQQLPAVHRSLAAGGAVLLAWLGVVAMRDMWHGRPPPPSGTAKR